MNRTVLIADDDPAVRALVSEYLTDRYTTCAQAADGAAAVRLAGECRPDAILLDLCMPGVDGFEACRSLKADPATRQIPVVFLTSNAGVPDKVRGLDLGAADYVTKPFDADELQARVRSVLRQGRDLRRANDRMARDELTGLFNRPYLYQRAEADLAASRRRGQPLACCTAAIDGWGGVVADRGAIGADDVLRAMAGRVLGALRREDVACRYDDRTIAVLGFTAGRLATVAMGERVQRAMAAALAGAGVGRAVNVGVALSHQSVGDTLIWHAAEAMRHAEATAKGTVQFGGELTEMHLAKSWAN